MALGEKQSLIKSRKRVRDHGEVFTPDWLVRDMCDLVGEACAQVGSRFLEPACGDGNFLVEILRRKLAAARRVAGGRADTARVFTYFDFTISYCSLYPFCATFAEK